MTHRQVAGPAREHPDKGLKSSARPRRLFQAAWLASRLTSWPLGLFHLFLRPDRSIPFECVSSGWDPAGGCLAPAAAPPAKRESARCPLPAASYLLPRRSVLVTRLTALGSRLCSPVPRFQPSQPASPSPPPGSVVAPLFALITQRLRPACAKWGRTRAGCAKATKAATSPPTHDADVHPDGTLAIQDARQHGDPLFRERHRCVAQAHAVGFGGHKL